MDTNKNTQFCIALKNTLSNAYTEKEMRTKIDNFAKIIGNNIATLDTKKIYQEKIDTCYFMQTEEYDKFLVCINIFNGTKIKVSIFHNVYNEYVDEYETPKKIYQAIEDEEELLYQVEVNIYKKKNSLTDSIIMMTNPIVTNSIIQKSYGIKCDFLKFMDTKFL